MSTPNRIEDLVRHSLQQRAEDVQPTPALWQEVDRRIARRRRLQVAVWSLAGATALVAAAVVGPGLLSGADPTPEVEPLPPGPEQGTDDADAEDPVENPAPDDPADADGSSADADDAPANDTDTGTGAAPVQTEPLLVASGRTIDLIGEDGRVNVLEMDAEGESWIMGLAVRPGSTADDYTAAVLTTAEGLWDLRHLHVADGEVVTWEPFPQEHLRPYLWRESTVGDSVTGPVFSPDGDALAWIEGTWDQPTLRVIGWTDNGPGTGDPIDDNTAFSLEPEGLAAGQPFVLHEWIGPVPGEDADGAVLTALTLTLEEPVSGVSYQPIERQADGAWALPSAWVWPGGSDPGAEGATYATAGLVGEGEPLWILQLEDEGLVLHRDPFGATNGRPASTVPLPADLMPGEGFPTLWVREVGDAALVGSANTSTAYLVDPDGNVGRVEGDVAWAAPIR